MPASNERKMLSSNEALKELIMIRSLDVVLALWQPNFSLSFSHSCLCIYNGGQCGRVCSKASWADWSCRIWSWGSDRTEFVILFRPHSITALKMHCELLISLRRFLHNHDNIVTERNLKPGLCPTLILNDFKGLYIVHSTIGTMPARDSNLVPSGYTPQSIRISHRSRPKMHCR